VQCWRNKPLRRTVRQRILGLSSRFYSGHAAADECDGFARLAHGARCDEGGDGSPSNTDSICCFIRVYNLATDTHSLAPTFRHVWRSRCTDARLCWSLFDALVTDSALGATLAATLLQRQACFARVASTGGFARIFRQCAAKAAGAIGIEIDPRWIQGEWFWWDPNTHSLSFAQAAWRCCCAWQFSKCFRNCIPNMLSYTLHDSKEC